MTSERVPGASTAGPQGRVAIVQRQVRPTLLLAAAFAVAAPAAVVLPHRTGRWRPLHLFPDRVHRRLAAPHRRCRGPCRGTIRESCGGALEFLGDLTTEAVAGTPYWDLWP